MCPAVDAEPTTVLVVDDSAFDRQLVGKLLESLTDVRLVYACQRHTKGWPPSCARPRPSSSPTWSCPTWKASSWSSKVRVQYPHISVILVTAYGSEEVAMQALRAGAANYIPKKHLARDLVPTLRHVLPIAAMTRERRRILGAWSGASRRSFSKTIPI